MTVTIDVESRKKSEDIIVSLQTLSDLTGFPFEVIRKELLLDEKAKAEDEISMQELRELMAKFIDKTMME